ncbi:hypothetical protein, partial [Pseudomonas sp. 50_B]|uniref:hypothetical protein n=1 Tax=Pseudomonas sp. 50_B TaxID=2813574 RepID=UPI001A9D05F4
SAGDAKPASPIFLTYRAAWFCERERSFAAFGSGYKEPACAPWFWLLILILIFRPLPSRPSVGVA